MRIFSILLVFLIAISCANQGNLTGGVKDETPPQLLSAIPVNQTTNFTSNGFELFFDENIKLQNVNENLLISPFLSEKPKIKIRPQSIEVRFEEELQPNTTYTFNFGNAIQDLNEGNPLAGFTYVFSTGPILDTAILSGSAILSQDASIPEKGAWALLYRSTEDSSFIATQPDYAAPIGEDGSYRFQNVKAGTYKLYGLRDNNSNYFRDLPNEELAFSDLLVTVTDSTRVEATLQFFQPVPQAGFVRQAVRDKPQSFVIETSTDQSLFGFEFMPNIQPTHTSKYVDSVRYWFTNELPDSMLVSFNDVVSDTVVFRILDKELTDTLFKLKVKNTEPFSFHNDVKLSAKRPFSNNGEAIVLLEDSLFVAGGVELIQDSLLAQEYIINYPWAHGKEYIMQIDDSTFVDIYGLPSDSLGVNFTVPDVESLSALQVKLNSEEFSNSPIIFQLRKGKETYLERVVQSIENQIDINDLPPGKYTTRIIIDENGNGKWDTGSFTNKRQPELVLNYETPIELRSNWDLEVEINLDE